MAHLIRQDGYFHIRVKHKQKVIHQETTGIPVGIKPREMAVNLQAAMNKLDEFHNPAKAQKIQASDFRSYGKSLLEQMPDLEYQPGTIQLYKHSIDQFIDVAGNKMLTQYTGADVQLFIKSLIAAGKKKNTIIIRFNKLRAIFNHAIEDGYLYINPCRARIKKSKVEDAIKRMQNIKQEYETYTESEMKRIFKSGIFPVAIASMLSDDNGMRENEILQLKWPNLDLTDRSVKIINKETFKTKTGDIRIVPVSKRTVKELIKLGPKKDGFVFLTGKGKPFTKRYFQQMFNSMKKEQGFTDERTFHNIRHTVITRLLDKGHPVEKVMHLTGIKDYKTIRVYTHMNIKHIRNLVK